MTISRTHKRVLLAAIIIAAGSTIFLLAVKPAPKTGLSYNCFKTEQGWGYDVLVDDRIIIHQPFIPGVSGIHGFTTKQEAGADAQTVIDKIKSGELPLFDQKQLQRKNTTLTP